LKLGILGGTFDPIHLGHLRTAEEIGQELDLEKVYLIPSASPPHKTGAPVTPFHHRLTMTQLAVSDSAILDVLDLEGNRPGMSYSYETLRELHAMFKPDPEIYFILGIDAFLEIKTWKRHKDLFDLAHFVIISRAGYPMEELEPFVSSSGLGIRKTSTADRFVMPSGKSLLVRETTLMEISSTHIREMAAMGRSIRFLVDGPVGDYIAQKGLYD